VSNEKIKILIVDDQPFIRSLAERILKEKNYATAHAHDGKEAIEKVEAESPDLVLMDIHMPGTDGISALKHIIKHTPDVPVIIMSGDADVHLAVDAMKHGARDYLTIPFNNDELIMEVERALEETKLKREVRRLKRLVGQSSDLFELMGYSNLIRHLHEQIATVAATDFTVIIYGESGSGKELVARAIHHHSPRADGPFIAVDCGSIPETLIESELFGHERGAFTGAVDRKKGSFERAAGGTLFLDEIANLPKTMQSKFLRAIQERAVERIGGAGPIDVDIRIIVACNKRLDELVVAGAFREDLYHRLNEFVINIPPLRKRKDDLIYLAKRFMDETSKELRKEVASISDEALQILLDYDWPGNVRELRNTIRRAVLLCDNTIEPHHLTALTSLDSLPMTPEINLDTLEQVPLKEIVRSAAAHVERNVIAHILQKTDGNKSQAARIMQIDYKTMLSKANHYGLNEHRK